MQKHSFRATISYGFSSSDPNSSATLVTAFQQLGWRKVGRCVFTIDTDDVGTALEAATLFATQAAHIGDLSHLAFNVVGAASFDGQEYRAARNHRGALGRLRRRTTR